MHTKSLFPSIVRDRTKSSFRLTLVAGFLLVLPGIAIADTLYVAADGDDAHPGTQSQPLRTLQGARDRVRALDKNRTQDVVVLLQAGDYFTDETICFGEQDSGVNGTRVIYRNRDELGSAHLIGGRPVTEWKDEGAGVYSARLDRNAYALFENDVPAVMAREPNESYRQFESVTDFRHLRYRAADYSRFDYQDAAVRLSAHRYRQDPDPIRRL